MSENEHGGNRKSPPRRRKPVPLYVQVKNELLSWLNDGSWPPDQRLPSEHELAERFGVSRQTVRQTFSELEQEGRVYRVQGKGTFAAAPGAPAPAGTDALLTVGVVTTYISDYIFPHIVRGIEQTLRDNGARLMLSSTDNDKQKERESLLAMLSQPLSGLIIEPTKSAEGNPNVDCFLQLESRGIPYVTINETYPELAAPCFRVDDEAGAKLSAEHLLGQGHTRIAGFFKTDDRQGVSRLRGFLSAMRFARRPLPPERVVQYTTEQKDTLPQDRLAEMLGHPERPTAIVCYNDELAVSLLETIRQAGLRVPEDVSVVGFDDSPLATATETKLTTVAHPKAQLGSAAAEALLRMIANPKDRHSRLGERGLRYKPVLIERESVSLLRNDVRTT